MGILLKQNGGAVLQTSKSKPKPKPKPITEQWPLSSGPPDEPLDGLSDGLLDELSEEEIKPVKTSTPNYWLLSLWGSLSGLRNISFDEENRAYILEFSTPDMAAEACREISDGVAQQDAIYLAGNRIAINPSVSTEYYSIRYFLEQFRKSKTTTGKATDGKATDDASAFYIINPSAERHPYNGSCTIAYEEYVIATGRSEHKADVIGQAKLEEDARFRALKARLRSMLIDVYIATLFPGKVFSAQDYVEMREIVSGKISFVGNSSDIQKQIAHYQIAHYQTAVSLDTVKALYQDIDTNIQSLKEHRFTPGAGLVLFFENTMRPYLLKDRNQNLNTDGGCYTITEAGINQLIKEQQCIEYLAAEIGNMPVKVVFEAKEQKYRFEFSSFFSATKFHQEVRARECAFGKLYTQFVFDSDKNFCISTAALEKIAAPNTSYLSLLLSFVSGYLSQNWFILFTAIASSLYYYAVPFVITMFGLSIFAGSFQYFMLALAMSAVVFMLGVLIKIVWRMVTQPEIYRTFREARKNIFKNTPYNMLSLKSSKLEQALSANPVPFDLVSIGLSLDDDKIICYKQDNYFKLVWTNKDMMRDILGLLMKCGDYHSASDGSGVYVKPDVLEFVCYMRLFQKCLGLNKIESVERDPDKVIMSFEEDDRQQHNQLTLLLKHNNIKYVSGESGMGPTLLIKRTHLKAFFKLVHSKRLNERRTGGAHSEMSDEDVFDLRLTQQIALITGCILKGAQGRPAVQRLDEGCFEVNFSNSTQAHQALCQLRRVLVGGVSRSVTLVEGQYGIGGKTSLRLTKAAVTQLVPPDSLWLNRTFNSLWQSINGPGCQYVILWAAQAIGVALATMSHTLVTNWVGVAMVAFCISSTPVINAIVAVILIALVAALVCWAIFKFVLKTEWYHAMTETSTMKGGSALKHLSLKMGDVKPDKDFLSRQPEQPTFAR